MSPLLYLIALVVSLSYSIMALANENADDKKIVKIIEPTKSVTTAQSAAIDTEHFELGLYTGFLAVEDFNSNVVVGASLTYHINRPWMLQFNYGESEVSQASFEGNFDFLGDGDTFEYYHLLAGYKVLHGRSFLGRKRKYNSLITLLAGLGSVDFASETNTSFVLGIGYKAVITDWLTINLDFRDHLFNRSIESLNEEEKLTQNVELILGVSALF